jgi:hypothetical protein
MGLHGLLQHLTCYWWLYSLLLVWISLYFLSIFTTPCPLPLHFIIYILTPTTVNCSCILPSSEYLFLHGFSQVSCPKSGPSVYVYMWLQSSYLLHVGQISYLLLLCPLLILFWLLLPTVPGNEIRSTQSRTDHTTKKLAIYYGFEGQTVELRTRIICLRVAPCCVCSCHHGNETGSLWRQKRRKITNLLLR